MKALKRVVMNQIMNDRFITHVNEEQQTNLEEKYHGRVLFTDQNRIFRSMWNYKC
jgi:hypothetical protein